MAFALQAPSRGWRPTTMVVRSRGALQLAGRADAGARLRRGRRAGRGRRGRGGLGRLDARKQCRRRSLARIWSVGSLAGGVFTARLGGGARGAVGLSLILAALACGHVTAAVASGDLVSLAIALLIAGTALAPTFASVYAMVDRVAPAGSVTEAFAWLATALAVGGAAGSALAGVLADRSGPSDAFVLAGAAGIAAALTTVLRARTLGETVEPQDTQPATA